MQTIPHSGRATAIAMATGSDPGPYALRNQSRPPHVVGHRCGPSHIRGEPPRSRCPPGATPAHTPGRANPARPTLQGIVADHPACTARPRDRQCCGRRPAFVRPTDQSPTTTTLCGIPAPAAPPRRLEASRTFATNPSAKESTGKVGMGGICNRDLLKVSQHVLHQHTHPAPRKPKTREGRARWQLGRPISPTPPPRARTVHRSRANRLIEPPIVDLRQTADAPPAHHTAPGESADRAPETSGPWNMPRPPLGVRSGPSRVRPPPARPRACAPRSSTPRRAP